MPPVASTDTVRRVRRYVRDDTSPERYEDEVYFDAIQFALEKLSFDFAEDYVFDTDVPVARRFLLVKLAAINMAYIRAADEADGGASGADPGDITMITVPDLTIQEGATTSGADIWLGLADRLQKEYEAEVGVKGTTAGTTETLPTVQVQTMFRTALRSGSRAKYALDAGIVAPENFDCVPAGSDVVVSWDPVFSDHFLRYEFFRALAPDTLDEPADAQRFKSLSDPHGETFGTMSRTRFTVTGLASGTYEFRMAAVSDNTLHAFTDIVTVVVP